METIQTEQECKEALAKCHTIGILDADITHFTCLKTRLNDLIRMAENTTAETEEEFRKRGFEE